MAKNDHTLVAHVDADTHAKFNALAERLGDRRSALLRKLVMRAVQDDADGLFELRPLGRRRQQPAKATD